MTHWHYAKFEEGKTRICFSISSSIASSRADRKRSLKPSMDEWMMLLGVSLWGWWWMSIARRRIGKKRTFLLRSFHWRGVLKFVSSYSSFFFYFEILKYVHLLLSKALERNVPCKARAHDSFCSEKRSLPSTAHCRRCDARRRRGTLGKKAEDRVKYCSMCGVGMAFSLVSQP